ncbi:MAG TPA: response regulator transcription factor [Actinomycetota bacterium]|nr:response regulator transcription factor [Actinomycetota bacterium]
MADIVIVTDRPEDLWGLKNGLETGGHRVVLATMAPSPADTDPRVVIVDAVKDLTRGRDACRSIRAASPRAPLLALVSIETIDALGPDWEIDSFMVDPIAIPEALARIRIALGSQVMESAGTVRVGDLAIDPTTYQVRLRGRPLDLTYKEFQLLFFLAQRPGRVYSRQQLLQEVWGYDFFGGTRTVDVHVRRLRAKLGAEHENMIATIRNVGYKLESHRTMR